VREIFKLARENKPAIIFIDELEAIGAQRSNDLNTYSMHSERYATLNQLLAELDGVNSDNDNIVIIAATNREDLLDSALVRPGRFDVKINVGFPDLKQRKDIIKLYLNRFNYDKLEITEDIIGLFAKECENFSGANLEVIVNEAATISFSKGRDNIIVEDLFESFEKNVKDIKQFLHYEKRNALSY
jgi:cell division protease FtsH